MMKYFDGNTLYWDLKQDVPTPQGKNKVYTTSYTIKLDNTKESFIPYEGEFRPTNGVTSLTYIIYDENGAPIPPRPQEARNQPAHRLLQGAHRQERPARGGIHRQLPVQR